MSKYLVPVLLGVVVLGSGLYLANNGSQVAPAPTPAPLPTPVTTTTTTTTTTTNNSVKTIQISDSKVEPMEITIKQGDTVTFINKGQNNHWPASNIHPTHTIYPGSDIRKCGTSEEKNIFDACRGLRPGESYSFRFNEAGIWRWHDHLYPTMHGTITVQ